MRMENSLKVGCLKASLPEIRNFIWGRLEYVLLPDSEKNLIVLAIDEVCANLIVHSNKSNPKKSIEIEAGSNGNSFVCKIHDSGKKFDIVEYKTPAMEDLIKQRRNGGIGLILVKKIMDEIELVSEGKKNIYVLSKTISRPVL
jgi:serine/threonine-protein kinase RsbW